MDIPVFTMVGEWKCKEGEWKFEPEEGIFGCCVRVQETMTYTDFVRTLREAFSLKSTEINPIISYWMPGEMSHGEVSESDRVFDSATNVDENNEDAEEQADVEDDTTEEDELEEGNEDDDGCDDYLGVDGSIGGSTLYPTTDGSEGIGEEYEEYVQGNLEEDVSLTQQTAQHPGEFSRLLETCTYTGVSVPGGDTGEFSRLLETCTYTGLSVPGEETISPLGYGTRCKGQRDSNLICIDEVTGDEVIDGIGASSTGTQNDNWVVTAAEAYQVYNEFSKLHGGELANLGNDAAPVEISTTGETLFVGSVFKNRKVLQQTMSLQAIKQCFCFKQPKSCPKTLKMVCVDETCPWQLTARVVKDSESFKITSYATTHTCNIDSRKNYNKHANYKLLGEVVRSRYSSTQGGPRAVDLPQLLLNDLNWKMYGGDEIANYRFLPTYLYLLQLANPGTITHLHYTEDDGKQRFKYVFVSLGASIKGLIYMRKVVVVDGTQLVGPYKGCLLIACAQDGNFQIFPIAFGVVDGETDASWAWFFEKLAEIVPDSDDLMIVSDRHSSLYKGLSVVYPRAHHGACAVHLERNLSTYYGKFGVSALFFSAAKAYRVRDFEKYFELLREKSGKCAKYLEDIGFEHWTRAHCRGERYNIMSSNNSESMNHVLTKAKTYPIVYMIEFIRDVLMRWFASRRKKVARCKSSVTPEVDERFLQELPASGKYAVKMSGPWSYQVTSKSGEHFHVVLDHCTCTCLRYTKLRIPCEHALAAAIEHGIDPKSCVGWWYGLQTFSDSFQEPILPIPDPKDVVIPQHIVDLILIPPYSRRPPGRPLSKRIPSRGENRVCTNIVHSYTCILKYYHAEICNFLSLSLQKKRQKRLLPNQCSRCRQAGHNKKTCKKSNLVPVTSF
uniref:Mutator-like transposase n=1 Tax=Arabidopsis thaliana TaxID=3702 RepID=O80973_ARATH|nr:Mutator-like transposase [Arabidopsis thaliana]